MLRKEQNDLLTQTGPGTPLGALFRSYCAPVRVQLLSEHLLAFRDSDGRYGLISEFCAHRGVSLWFGRNEEGGIRCAYHGWKYDVAGQCIDVPSEPATFCGRVKLQAYPLVKQGDVLWTYMGPAQRRPPLPEFEFSLVPAEQSFTSKRFQQCNWLQALEGGIDSSHVSWLHRANLDSDPLFKGAKGNEYNLKDPKPVFDVVPSAGGLLIGARRNAENGSYYWRITPWVMPCFTMVPPRGDHPVHGHFWIPIDDDHCWAWTFDYHPVRALTAAERQAMRDGKGVHAATLPGTYLPRANKGNDYLMDRPAQKQGLAYSGIEGIAMQDASLQESMGAVADRTKEHLTSTDSGIVKARMQLLKAARALEEKGEVPPGVDPAHHRVRSAAVILPPDEPFNEAAKDALTVQPGRPHASV
jgi:nitrite reductase/ring-hydroxylating ferredoxin subunit